MTEETRELRELVGYLDRGVNAFDPHDLTGRRIIFFNLWQIADILHRVSERLDRLEARE